MDIYKLKDFEVQACGENEDNVLKITNMKQGVKNPNRVTVFVNDKYAFSLDVAQVVDLGVKVGQKISEERLAELKNASEFGKLYQRTLEWALIRPRSIKETKDYLYRKLKMSFSERSSRPSSRGSSLRPRSNCGCSSEDILEFSGGIISRLCEKGYLDDERFAEWYVENRFVKKGISKKRLKMELVKKGVASDIVEEVLTKRNDEEELLKIIAKKRNKYDDEKLINYLCRQGFEFQLVQNLVRTYGKD